METNPTPANDDAPAMRSVCADPQTGLLVCSGSPDFVQRHADQVRVRWSRLSTALGRVSARLVVATGAMTGVDLERAIRIGRSPNGRTVDFS